MTRARKFIYTLASQLRDTQVVDIPPKVYELTGRLDTGAVIVPVTVQVPWRFKELKQKPPVVQCAASWMRKGADWHNGETMCWVLPLMWRGIMSWKGKSTNSIIHEGVEWLVNDVRVLINRHYYAHIAGIEQWPEEWKYWSHFGEGIKEYKKSYAEGAIGIPA